ncbi:hypothetical protein V6N13_030820 [Hibiscus sabdariffa]|uniref:Uncharacterized protein n=1 Tax=Hibiscus sabdariffa TaxID=183260 RepID=A0ABR2D792_9ROSI
MIQQWIGLRGGVHGSQQESSGDLWWDHPTLVILGNNQFIDIQQFGETPYQHTKVSSSKLSNVFEQPTVHTTFGDSSSSYACHDDDDIYRPQFEYPQPSIYWQGMGVDSMASWLSTTTIFTPLFYITFYANDG